MIQRQNTLERRCSADGRISLGRESHDVMLLCATQYFEYCYKVHVRTISQNGTLNNINGEVARLRINIMGLCKVRRIQARLITSDDYAIPRR